MMSVTAMELRGTRLVCALAALTILPGAHALEWKRQFIDWGWPTRLPSRSTPYRGTS